MKTWVMMMVVVMNVVVVAFAQEQKERNGRAKLSEHYLGAGERPLMDMMNDLGLTPDQQSQLKALKQATTNEMNVLTVKMRALAVQQAKLLNQETPDEAALLKGTDDIGQVRTDIAKMRIKQMVAVQRILTPGQRAKMREKMKGLQGKRGGDGEGRGLRHKGAGRKGQDKLPAATTNTPPAVVPAT